MTRRLNHNAFVLVIALLVIAICGTVLASCARYSCQKALQASEAQRELQMRWGAISCKETILPAAESVLRESTEEKAPVLVERPSRYLSLTLGGLTYHLLLSDEQAKMNINTALRYRGKQGVTESLAVLQQDMPIHLTQRIGTLETGGKDTSSASYSFFDDLLVYDRPAQLVSPTEPSQRISSKITFWTDGRIHFRRASPAVLREAMKGILDSSLLGQLLQIRESLPDCTLGEAFSQMELKGTQQKQIFRYVTDQSNCHSLWVIVEGRSRLWHRLYISSPRGIVGTQTSRRYAW
ncbi:MAG: hypothetical protein JW849_00185 [Phycisphaerae bacterium]|nr:hypothetical protein [Phycisphaerae bacterium]